VDLTALANSIYADFNAIPKRELLMFYGDNGSGKTKLAIEVANDITPADKKILYVDTSAGYETINNHPDLYNSIAHRLLVLPFSGEDQLNTLATAVASRAEPFGVIGTVILDESSSMAQQYLDVVVEGRSRADRTKEADKADWPDFNIAGNKWRKTVQKFERIQGVSLIEVTHLRTDLKRKMEFITPAFQPTVGNETRKEKRGIFYCDIRAMKMPDGSTQNVRVVQTEKDDHVLAKTRIWYNGAPLPQVTTPDIIREAIKQDYFNRIDNTEPVEVE
jgi:energy-coupling factor transporter ATP-binding protein EcfA2